MVGPRAAAATAAPVVVTNSRRSMLLRLVIAMPSVVGEAWWGAALPGTALSWYGVAGYVVAGDRVQRLIRQRLTRQRSFGNASPGLSQSVYSTLRATWSACAGPVLDRTTDRQYSRPSACRPARNRSNASASWLCGRGAPATRDRRAQ